MQMAHLGRKMPHDLPQIPPLKLLQIAATTPWPDPSSSQTDPERARVELLTEMVRILGLYDSFWQKVHEMILDKFHSRMGKAQPV